MHILKKYPYHIFAYRSKEGFFYRSDKKLNYLHYVEFEDIINNNVNDLLDLFASKWSKNDNNEWVSGMYFDIDGNDLTLVHRRAVELYLWLKETFKVKSPSISFIFSGAKGFHIEIHPNVFGLEKSSPDDLDKFYRWFAKHVEKLLKLEGFIDFRVYEKKRLWRLEKSVNSKTGLFCHRLPEELIKADIDDIVEYCKYQRDYELFFYRTDKRITFPHYKFYEFYKKYKEETTRNVYEIKDPNVLNVEKDELPPCIMKLLNNEVQEGHRNTSLYVVSRALNKLFRLNQNEIYDYLLGWCLQSGMTEMEISATINSACSSTTPFGCFHSTYINQLIENGVTSCPYQGKTKEETRIMKRTLCPAYRQMKLFDKIERIKNRYTIQISKLYSQLSNAFKEKKWDEANNIILLINKIEMQKVSEVKNECSIGE